MRYRELPRQAGVLQEAVDDEVLVALCRRMLGAKTNLHASEPLAGGRFNTTYRLHFAGRPSLILRMAPPRSARLFRHEAALLRRECAIQPLLASTGTVFPRVVATDFSGTVVPRDCVLQNCLEGELWAEVAPRLAIEDNASLWRQFGFHVRRIHALEGSDYGFPAPAPIHHRYSTWLQELVAGMAADLAELGLRVDGLELFRSLLARGAALIDRAGPPRLVHGDLWPRNVLVTQRGDEWLISGILDAERAFWGDPAAEWIFSFLDIPDDFWRAYGRDLSTPMLDGDAVFRRCCYQARGALQLMLEAHRHGFAADFAHDDFVESLGHIAQMLNKSIDSLADAA